MRDAQRETFKALLKNAMMLAREQRGRNHHGNLRAGHRHHKGGAQSDFGLAETNITANQPIHRPAGGKVFQHIGNGAGLIFGLRKGEAGTKLIPHPFRRCGQSAILHAPHGRGADQFRRHVADA